MNTITRMILAALVVFAVGCGNNTTNTSADEGHQECVPHGAEGHVHDEMHTEECVEQLYHDHSH